MLFPGCSAASLRPSKAWAWLPKFGFARPAPALRPSSGLSLAHGSSRQGTCTPASTPESPGAMAGPSAFAAAGAMPAAAAQPAYDDGPGAAAAAGTGPGVHSYDTAPGMAGAAGHSIYEPPPPGARVVPGVQHHSHLPGQMSVSGSSETTAGQQAGKLLGLPPSKRW